MEIPKTNTTGTTQNRNQNKWTPERTWECILDCGIVTLNPCNRKAESCTDPNSVVAMLQNCHSAEENQAGNYTVRFDYGGGRVENTFFIGGCKNTPEADLLAMLHAVKVGQVFTPQTAEEAVSAWGVAA